MTAGHTPEEQQPPVVIRDKRRIDPESGEVRPEPVSTGSGTGSTDGAPDLSASGAAAVQTKEQLVAALEERTEDLLRVKAEYDNYRRRVERDRALAGELAASRVLAALLPTLDDIHRARDHGQLEGAFRQVAEGLEKTVAVLGLEAFGEVGEEFDPTLHDALMHAYSDDVEVPTTTTVMGRGYRYAERVLRPAQVGVTEPHADTPDIEPTTDSDEDPTPT